MGLEADNLEQQLEARDPDVRLMVQVRGDVDHPTNHGRVDGVVVGVEPDIVVAAEADLVAPA